MNRWWGPLLLVLIVGVTGVMLMGIRTYQEAPPIPDFVDGSGRVVFDREEVLTGQEVFQRYALMDYGSMFGDGASRGPDFTADALHTVSLAMREHYASARPAPADPTEADLQRDAVEVRVKRELKENRYEPATNRVVLSEGQAAAAARLLQRDRELFLGQGPESFQPVGYVKLDSEVHALTAFFFWGAWVCAAQRPGQATSYTHNWPFDEQAGNTPGAAVLLWSVLGLLALVVALGAVLFAHGRSSRLSGFIPEGRASQVLDEGRLAAFKPTPGQRATYKFFAAAAVLFTLQVTAGVLTVHDFLGLTRLFGLDVARAIPITVARGWHVQVAVLWVATCWVGGSIFVLPMIGHREPPGQRALINLLFGLLLVVAAGTLAGVWLGPMGRLGHAWRDLGNQGWEYVEMGRLWQVVLLLALALWAVVVARGVWPVLREQEPWSLPHWLLYTVVAVLLLFLSGFVADSRTNFVIADFWRWMVIHMWVEAFLEVFTTVVVAYFMTLMGLVTAKSAVRVVYLSTFLYLGSGILGISHNFYWNAKPVLTLAVGAVFSTLQVVPLVLLTLEAWKLRQLPAEALGAAQARGSFAQAGAFLFLLGVNFWNFMGAGVFGLSINLPIVNYYEHGTYLTVNHGHSAFMGVYGNLSLAALLFCARYLVVPEGWSDRLVRVAFWSLNGGLALMVALDLFPAGLLQLWAVLEHGLWYGRSSTFIQGTTFQTLTWLRAVGGPIFVVGGLLPLAWFTLSRYRMLKPASAPLADPARAVAPT